MKTIQVQDETHRLLMQTKLDKGAKSLDALVVEALLPTPTKEAVVRKIKAILPALRALGVQSVSLFGSVVRGEAKPGSDVDLIIDLEEGRTYMDLAEVQMVLEETMPVPWDLVLRGGLHPRLKDAILAEAEVLV